MEQGTIYLSATGRTLSAPCWSFSKADFRNLLDAWNRGLFGSLLPLRPPPDDRLATATPFSPSLARSIRLFILLDAHDSHPAYYAVHYSPQYFRGFGTLGSVFLSILLLLLMSGIYHCYCCPTVDFFYVLYPLLPLLLL